MLTRIGLGSLAMLLGMIVISRCTATEPDRKAHGQVPHTATTAEGYAPQAGDLVLFRNKSFVMNLLGAAAFSARTTHAGIVVARPNGELAILETPAVGASVTFNDIRKRMDTYAGQIWIRSPHVPLTAEQSARLTAFAQAQEGKAYDLLGFFSLPVSWPVPIFKRQHGLVDDLTASRWICSSLAVSACSATGLIDADDVWPRGACADDLRDDLFLDLSAGWGPARPWRTDPNSRRE